MCVAVILASYSAPSRRRTEITPRGSFVRVRNTSLAFVRMHPSENTTVPRATSSMLASSSAIIADLPPSSSAIFFNVGAAASMMRRPTAADPVNVIMSTSGWVVSTSPAAGSAAVTMFTTPGGMSVRSAINRPMWVADQGVSGGGLSTTVQPAANAGPSFAKLRKNG